MSGIVGIVNLDGAPVDRDLLWRMTNLMTFRGPDAQEIWIDGNVGFGHTMLRTTWEAETEKQPLTLDGKIWLVADARIDGREELIAKLEGKLGSKFWHGPSDQPGKEPRLGLNDAELILWAYKVWGQDCTHQLIGDFSFAIWDSATKGLMCVRSPFGLKPFFYARVKNAFVFSNTIGPLRQHPGVTDRLNDLAVADFLIFGFNQESETTTFENILRLPPANQLSVTADSIRTCTYWQPIIASERFKNSGDYADRFNELLSTSVRDRMRVPRVAVKMSGGVDSTTIAAFAARESKREGQHSEVSVFTVVYDKLIPDQERHYSSVAAAALRIPVHHFAADNYLPYQGWEEPELWTPEPVDFVFGLVARDLDSIIVRHSRVVLGGWGGDNLRVSIRSYITQQIRNGKLKQLLAEYGPYILKFWDRPSINISRSLKLRLGLSRYPSCEPFPQWIPKELDRQLNLEARWKNIRNSHPTPSANLQDFASTNIASIGMVYECEVNDPGFTKRPIEYRHPLLDTRLTSYMLSLPPVPFWLDKKLLRNSTKGLLPRSIRFRPKTVLAGDPFFECLKRNPETDFNTLTNDPILQRYVLSDSVPKLDRQNQRGVDDSEIRAYYQHLRPTALSRWIQTFKQA